MLPLLTSQVAVFIDTQKVVATRYTNSFRKKIAHHETILLEPRADQNEILNLIEILSDLFNKKDFKGYSTKLILSPHYTKQRVVQWKTELSTEDQKAILRHQLTDLYGFSGDSIEVVLSDQGYKKNTIAFTVDKILFKAINDLVSEKKIKSVSITPNFATRINYWHKTISQNAWIIVHEQKVVHFARVIENDWQSINTYSLSEISTLATIFNRELLFQEAADYSNIYLMTDHPEMFKDKAVTLVRNTQQKCFVLCPKNINQFSLDQRFLAFLD